MAEPYTAVTVSSLIQILQTAPLVPGPASEQSTVRCVDSNVLTGCSMAGPYTRTLAGLLSPTGGRIILNDVPLEGPPDGAVAADDPEAGAYLAVSFIIALTGVYPSRS